MQLGYLRHRTAASSSRLPVLDAKLRSCSWVLGGSLTTKNENARLEETCVLQSVADGLQPPVEPERFLLLKFRRPPCQPLDPLRNRRMRRKQVRKIYPQQRLNDKKMSRRRGGHHRHAPRISIQLLQSARQSVRISRKVSPGSIGLIFPRARHRQLNQPRRNRSHNQHHHRRQPSATAPPIAVATFHAAKNHGPA